MGHQYGNVENDFAEKSLNVNENLPAQNDFFVTPSMELDNERKKLMDLIPADQKNKYPVEVEEISYEEYLELQKMGDTFEEPLEEYEDSDGYESSEFNGYSDQQGFGTNNNYVRVKYNGPDKNNDNKLFSEKIRMRHLKDVENIRVLSPKNEVGFNTYNGFKTMSMTYKHKSDKTHEQRKIYKSGDLLKSPSGIWKIMGDGNVAEFNKELIAQNRMDTFSESEYEAPTGYGSDRIFGSPSFTENMLGNIEEIESQEDMNKIIDVNYEEPKNYGSNGLFGSPS